MFYKYFVFWSLLRLIWFMLHFLKTKKTTTSLLRSVQSYTTPPQFAKISRGNFSREFCTLKSSFQFYRFNWSQKLYTPRIPNNERTKSNETCKKQPGGIYLEVDLLVGWQSNCIACDYFIILSVTLTAFFGPFQNSWINANETEMVFNLCDFNFASHFT